MPTDDLVHLAAQRVTDALAARPWDDREKVLVRIVAHDDHRSEVEFGFTTFDGHPSEVLFGFVAPQEWVAIGVSTGGWATQLDTGRRRRVRSTAVLTRPGAHLALLEYEDGEITRMCEDGCGLVADLMRRTFGLDTPPPEATVAELFGVLWLTVALATWRRPTWPQLQEVQQDLQRHSRITPGDDWDDVRWRRVTGDLEWLKLGSEHAAWFDAGSFSRWVLGCYSALPDALDALRRQVSGATYRNVVRQLTSWGVDCGSSRNGPLRPAESA